MLEESPVLVTVEAQELLRRMLGYVEDFVEKEGAVRLLDAIP